MNRMMLTISNYSDVANRTSVTDELLERLDVTKSRDL